MAISFILAKMLAVLYVSIGLGILINREHFFKAYKTLLDSPALLYLTGLIVLLLGGVFVALHNDWQAGWPLVITLFGWMALLKGFLLLAFPRAMQKVARYFLKRSKFMTWEGLFALILGLVMAYLGFFSTTGP